jgi:hypothetical protein
MGFVSKVGNCERDVFADFYMTEQRDESLQCQMEGRVFVRNYTLILGKEHPAQDYHVIHHGAEMGVGLLGFSPNKP